MKAIIHPQASVTIRCTDIRCRMSCLRGCGRCTGFMLNRPISGPGLSMRLLSRQRQHAIVLRWGWICRVLVMEHYPPFTLRLSDIRGDKLCRHLVVANVEPNRYNGKRLAR